MRNQKIIKKNKKIKYYIISFFLLLMIFIFVYFIKITIDIEETKGEDENINVDKEDNVGKNNLPIIVIDTNGEKIETNNSVNDLNGKLITKSSPKIKSKFKLYDVYNFPEEVSIEEDITINVRGQSSLKFPKKQYTIRFIDDKNREKPIKLLGMSKHDKWVLNSSYGDKSLIRNYIGFKLARDIQDYAPRTRFVEVYLNDDNNMNFEEDYIGVYILIEKIERDEERVDIQKAEEKYKDVSFIIARDKIKEDDIVLKNDWSYLEEKYIINNEGVVNRRTSLTPVYPSSKKLSIKYKNKIVDYINDFEYLLRSNDFDDKKYGYRQYIDIDSFVNYAMVNEIVKNIDGGEVSAYFHKDIGGVMKAGPVWDFDLSLSNTDVEEVNEPTGFRIVDTIWFERLFQDNYFANRYKINYKKYRNSIWKTEKINKMIDDAVKQIGDAAYRNQKKWYPNDTPEDYQKEIDNIKKFLSERLEWMDRNVHLVKRLRQNTID
ncbi:CotH kinase family protein [Senegalia massiliensis]|uniref:CotH protein n=1 Tax=Senegalia massiliensis TaxID=1720316 RepID=A0A845QYA9_9CLOT|nr:CotH kinase family protein [Senegalia massiliensis]NBI06132.1 hypothetical protein [Senegalia massiliensis]